MTSLRNNLFEYTRYIPIAAKLFGVGKYNFPIQEVRYYYNRESFAICVYEGNRTHTYSWLYFDSLNLLNTYLDEQNLVEE